MVVNMKKIELKVDGMMCTGCENRIQNAVKNIEGVTEVKANHTDKTVKITVSTEVSDDEIKNVIEDLGFDVIG
jgi:copper chaperone CopZ